MTSCAEGLTFVALAINPIGGLVAAIPVAMLALSYPGWVAVAAGVPLAYVQVIVVDTCWSQLERWPAWRRMIEARRSARIARLMDSGGAFLPTLVLAPIIGPWVVMAFMRYAGVPQRRVAAPMLLGILWMAALLATACALVPSWFKR